MPFFQEKFCLHYLSEQCSIIGPQGSLTGGVDNYSFGDHFLTNASNETARPYNLEYIQGESNTPVHFFELY